ncbi:SnoaL-like polyketide cyclase [Litoreibacter ascidiaceicola]|uniref:SnoaL-like polyketide cyclase n=1 Tax=Litoreibacter ascidiaceicola TaxID=1486859 RepID=A0A1M4STZ0_9RHOB|nr:ester cyclase [Litoreibacter ascidiaceicola]SHE35666.1 SnoaL-like polyketide cyclase [Litoreibacter ascidiaceicola]
MTDFTAEKAISRAYMAEFDRAAPSDRLNRLKAHTSPDFHWRGVHPFNRQPSAKAAMQAFWTPLLNAFSSLQRREDVFFAGLNEIDGFTATWTCSMGHFMGLFDAPWLGIPPTGKMAFLRYAEFHRIENGKIAETALFCDVLSVMAQAGVDPLPPQTGAAFIVPGPMTNDGLLLSSSDPDEGKATLAIVNKMANSISKANEVLQGKSKTYLTPQQEMSENWHDDMIWYGPHGIGATYTIDRYITQHQAPFRTQLADRIFNGHVARFAEGKYCGFFGWPNLTVTPIGGYLGLPATGKPADMRVVDIYRRDGDKLAENWVIIDMLHFLKMQGLDVLERLNAGVR